MLFTEAYPQLNRWAYKWAKKLGYALHYQHLSLTL